MVYPKFLCEHIALIHLFMYIVPQSSLWTHIMYTVLYIYIVYLSLFVGVYYVHSLYMYCVPKDPLWTHRTSKVVCVCVVYTSFRGRHILCTQFVYTLCTPSSFVYTYYIHSFYISAVPLGGCLAYSISLLNHRTPIVKSVPINQVTPIY